MALLDRGFKSFPRNHRSLVVKQVNRQDALPRSGPGLLHGAEVVL